MSTHPPVWVPSTGSFRVYRGSAAAIVQDMAGGHPTLNTPEAIRQLVTALWTARGVRVALPWGLPDEAVAEAFLGALQDIGLARPVPQA